MAFENMTRNKYAVLPTQNYASGGISQLELPKTGLLARLWLHFSITIGGTVNAANARGIASAIRRVRLQTNSGTDIFNVSGIGYGYMLQNCVELNGVNGRQPANQFNTAVTATSFNLDMVVPIQMNMGDPLGLIMLQDEQLQVILTIEWESQTVIGGSTATATGTCIPVLEFFTVPANPTPGKPNPNLPPLNVIHQIIEDQFVLSQTSGDYLYNAPRGNTYLGLYFGYGLGVSAADNWSRLLLRINQNDIIYDSSPTLATQRVGYWGNLTRGLGFIPINLLASNGLGDYGSARDFINTALLTDFQGVLTVTAADTLFVIRRMLMPIG